jgi:hypothetical protein
MLRAIAGGGWVRRCVVIFFNLNRFVGDIFLKDRSKMVVGGGEICRAILSFLTF